MLLTSCFHQSSMQHLHSIGINERFCHVSKHFIFTSMTEAKQQPGPDAVCLEG